MTFCKFAKKTSPSLFGLQYSSSWRGEGDLAKVRNSEFLQHPQYFFSEKSWVLQTRTFLSVKVFRPVLFCPDLKVILHYFPSIWLENSDRRFCKKSAAWFFCCKLIADSDQFNYSASILNRTFQNCWNYSFGQFFRG